MNRLIPPRRDEVITPGGAMTQRFAEYLESMSNVVNVQQEEITSSVDVNIDTHTVLTELLLRLGSGDPLTSDCDSFTVDSDLFSADMDEA